MAEEGAPAGSRYRRELRSALRHTAAALRAPGPAQLQSARVLRSVVADAADDFDANIRAHVLAISIDAALGASSTQAMKEFLQVRRVCVTRPRERTSHRSSFL